MEKILSLIGGGSVRTYYFIESLLKFHRALGIGEVRIMDNDAEKLRYFGGIAAFLAARADSGLKVTLTENAEDALRGADYVVTTIRVGQDEARTKDERIALSEGLIGQETTGAGGFSYAIRTIPVMIAYMKLIRRLAKPGAPVFNFTNPAGLVTQALYDAGFEGVIGICDNATGIKTDTAAALEVNASDLRVMVYGLNHLSWASRVELGGTDILPKLMANDGFVRNFHQFLYFDRDLIRRIGQIPNGYLYYYYHRERALENLLAAPETRGEFILRNNRAMMDALRELDVSREPERCFAVYRDFMQRRESSYMSTELGGEALHPAKIRPETLGVDALKDRPPVTEICEGYAGVVFNYIDSCVHDKGIDLAVSIPNHGAVPGMEDDDVVEVTALVGKDGAVPCRFDRAEVRPANLALMKTVKAYEKLTIEAVLRHSKAAAVEALTVHPLVGDHAKAKRLVEAYTALNKPWIGEWT